MLSTYVSRENSQFLMPLFWSTGSCLLGTHYLLVYIWESNCFSKTTFLNGRRSVCPPRQSLFTPETLWENSIARSLSWYLPRKSFAAKSLKKSSIWWATAWNPAKSAPPNQKGGIARPPPPPERGSNRFFFLCVPDKKTAKSGAYRFQINQSFQKKKIPHCVNRSAHNWRRKWCDALWRLILNLRRLNLAASAIFLGGKRSGSSAGKRRSEERNIEREREKKTELIIWRGNFVAVSWRSEIPRRLFFSLPHFIFDYREFAHNSRERFAWFMIPRKVGSREQRSFCRARTSLQSVISSSGRARSEMS